MKEKTILVIEDDHSIIKFLTMSLKTNDYRVMVAQSGIEGISLFMSAHPDVILLDLGLPDVDGSEVIEQIRTQSEVPILVVSARGQEQDKVKALDQGADDFITKPFHINELLARIRVALRKNPLLVPHATIFQLDDFLLDFEKHQVKVRGQEVHFTPIEYKLICLLVQNAGKVLTHHYLIKEIWGYQSGEDSQSLRVFMANIRRKIEQDSAHPRFIKTEVGVGYRFVEQ